MRGTSFSDFEQGRCPFPCIRMRVMRHRLFERNPFCFTEKQYHLMVFSLHLTHRLLLLDLVKPLFLKEFSITDLDC
jgi:hypothetical protein